MTADDLRDFLVTTLMRKHGGNRRQWRMAVGSVKRYALSTHPHCNWSIAPSGSITQVAAIERLVDDVRASHPHVDA